MIDVKEMDLAGENVSTAVNVVRSHQNEDFSEHVTEKTACEDCDMNVESEPVSEPNLDEQPIDEE